MEQDPTAATVPAAYRRVRQLLALVVRVFFRRLEVAGVDRIPADRGGILIAWHPNGLVDPALILSVFPRQVVFGARHGLLRLPLLGRLARALGTVPIYRSQDVPSEDVDERRRRNDESLDALADSIARGSFSALFPEGISHDEPFLQQIKSGAARLYYRARARTASGRPPPAIIPVGLHYNEKRLFRSSALIVFHSPLVLPPELDVTPSPDEDAEVLRERARALTSRMEEKLQEVVLETESWEMHQLMHRARKLVRAERAARAGARPGAASMEERWVGMARIWVGYRSVERTRPVEVARLRRRIQRYDGYLRALRMEDHELDRPPPILHPLLWIMLVLQIVAVFALLPPLLLVGLVVNGPPAAIVTAGAHLHAKEHKDIASLKLLGGLVLFPATWALWAWLAAEGVGPLRSYAPWLTAGPAVAAAGMVAMSLAGGVVMLLYVELTIGRVRAVRVRLTRGMRARALTRLKKERVRLYEDLIALADGLELPGVVHPDGRVASGR